MCAPYLFLEKRDWEANIGDYGWGRVLFKLGIQSWRLGFITYLFEISSGIHTLCWIFDMIGNFPWLQSFGFTSRSPVLREYCYRVKCSSAVTIWPTPFTTLIFDKISWNKIWYSLLCNALIWLIFMHWTSPFRVCKVEAFPNAWSPPSTPVAMLVAPVSRKRNLVLQYFTGVAGW